MTDLRHLLSDRSFDDFIELYSCIRHECEENVEDDGGEVLTTENLLGGEWATQILRSFIEMQLPADARNHLRVLATAKRWPMQPEDIVFHFSKPVLSTRFLCELRKLANIYAIDVAKPALINARAGRVEQGAGRRVDRARNWVPNDVKDAVRALDAGKHRTRLATVTVNSSAQPVAVHKDGDEDFVGNVGQKPHNVDIGMAPQYDYPSSDDEDQGLSLTRRSTAVNRMPREMQANLVARGKHWRSRGFTCLRMNTMIMSREECMEIQV